MSGKSMNIKLLPAVLLIVAAVLHGDGFRFVVTSDTQGGDGGGVNSVMLAEIVQATINEGAEFILVSGDIVDGTAGQGTFKSQLIHWRDIMTPLYDAGVGVYPVRGNHDNGTKADWDDVFSGDYALPANGPAGQENITYSFTYDNAFIVGVDQYVDPHRVCQDWLDAQFAANTQEHVFVFGHEPAFKLVHTDCLGEYPDDRDIFWSSIAAEGGRVYFCGHDHSYDHARLDDNDGNPYDDVHQIISIGGGELFYDGVFDGDNGPWVPLRVDHENIMQGRQGYVLVEIDGPNAVVTWKYRTDPGVFVVGDVFCYTTAAVDPPVIDFPDAHLEAVIAAELAVAWPNADDILDLVVLDANACAISDLSGLEYAANLTELDLSDNGISDIWALTSLTNLSVLQLDNNPLDRAAYCVCLPRILANNPGIILTYPVNPNPMDDCIVDWADPNLKTAVETQLGVADPNFTDMLDLIVLEAFRKGITDLTGLQYARNLSWLHLPLSAIEDLSPLSGMKYLADLNLTGNCIEDISPLSTLKNLSHLRLINNHISDISAIAQRDMAKLHLGGNPLNTPAYCRVLPLIEERNPAIDISYDANTNPLTGDCLIDWDDFIVFLDQWLSQGCVEGNAWCHGADLDYGGDVDFEDFACLTTLWMGF